MYRHVEAPPPSVLQRTSSPSLVEEAQSGDIWPMHPWAAEALCDFSWGETTTHDLIRYLAHPDYFGQDVSAHELQISLFDMTRPYIDGLLYSVTAAGRSALAEAQTGLAIYALGGRFSSRRLDFDHPVGTKLLSRARVYLLDEFTRKLETDGRAAMALRRALEFTVGDKWQLESVVSPTELRLLEALIRAYPRMVSHSYVITQVWGDGDPFLLRETVYRLRSVLDDTAQPGSGLSIITHYKKGYTLAPVHKAP